MRILATSAALAALLASGPGAAADFADPTWPCVQRKVGRLSPALMWPEPPAEAPALSEATSEAVDALVERLALRRIPVEETAPLVASFAEAHGAGTALLGHVFAEVFRRLDGTRTAVVAGIEDFSLQQIALSERIDAARGEMDAQMARAEPDFDRVDALEEQVDWDQRIFTDRQRSLTYVCETPVLIERRLFAIAQLLAGAVDG